MDFLKEFNKTVDNIKGVTGSSQPPRYWFSTGNHVLNKVISGSFNRGIPQGRLTGLVGPSSSGKSFVLGNIVREAQKSGAFCLVIDSENAFDDEFATAIGIDVNKDYEYKSVTTIPQVTKIVSAFLKGYKGEYGSAEDAPQVLITVDSLDMLLTETELDHYSKGNQKGDQGQRNKQLKAMLRTFVQDIKSLNVSMVITDQVYRNQDLLNGEGNWMVKDAVKYSLSQVILLTKLKLRDKATRDVEGIRMKCEGYKSRFTKPFQSVTIEVPYETGIDPYNGLLEVAKDLGIVTQAGAWYKLGDNKFQSKNSAEYMEDILVKAEAKREEFLEAVIDDGVEEDLTAPETGKSRRKAKVSKDK